VATVVAVPGSGASIALGFCNIRRARTSATRSYSFKSHRRGQRPRDERQRVHSCCVYWFWWRSSITDGTETHDANVEFAAFCRVAHSSWLHHTGGRHGSATEPGRDGPGAARALIGHRWGAVESGPALQRAPDGLKLGTGTDRPTCELIGEAAHSAERQGRDQARAPLRSDNPSAPSAIPQRHLSH
jgi:hypothetical protein